MRRQEPSVAGAARIALAIFFAVCATGCADADGESSEADLRRWRESGRYHFEVTRDLDRAIAAFESLTVAYPGDPEGLLGLGEALATAPREWSRAAGLFEAAIAVDSQNVDAHSGLFDATVRLGDLETAARVQERFVRLRPDHPYPYIEAVRLAWQREDREAVERSLARLLEAFPDDRTVRAWVSEERARIALVDGRLRQADAHFVDALAEAFAREDPAEIIERTVDRAWALVWWSADTAAALALVDSVTRAYPMAAMPMAEWPFHYLAEFQALAGRPVNAVRILESHADHMDPPPEARPNPWWQAAWGLVALDVAKPEEAVRRFRLWDEGIGCSICALGDLARALEAAGEEDSAAIVWERYLEASDPQRIEWDPYYLALARQRLSEIYERSGRTSEALALRGALARQWTAADKRLRLQIPGPADSG
jgi:tetratricopeptide (TPR) repeat protein